MDKEPDLTIDPGISGGELRHRMLEILGYYTYYSDKHTFWDTRKKLSESLLEQAVEKVLNIRGQMALEKGLKAKAQEVFIKDVWSTKVTVVTAEGVELEGTPQDFNLSLMHDLGQESFYRHKMNQCEMSLDISRTALSWDKSEVILGR